jgi:NAD(P)-dependent dehydrogenase (short-subunit alcohol dehydrogenase family)
MHVPSHAGKARVIAVTGASGNIGSYFARHAADRYTLRLMVEDGADVDAIRRYGEVVTCDLGDLAGLKAGFEGADTVLHLAASADPGSVWADLLPNNIIGTYNAMVAARSAGCRRLVFASSIHAVSGYPPDVQVKTTEPVNPGDLYGVTKCFGEALGRYMAEKEGLSVIAIRIGAFQPGETAEKDDELWMLDAWVSQRDLYQLIERAIDAPDVTFAIVHGLSDNRFKRLDISSARDLLGYAPVDDAARENRRLAGTGLAEAGMEHDVHSPTQESGIRDDL